MTIKHCEDYIDDEAASPALRAFLEWNRQPAIKKMSDQGPRLFAVLRSDLIGKSYMGYWSKGEPVMQDVAMRAGQRVRVVMASRLGDVGITPNLDAEHGYVARVAVSQLEDFGASA